MHTGSMLRYAITDRRRLATNERERRTALLQHVARWASDGIDYIQIREKDLSPAEIADLALTLRSTLADYAPDKSRRPHLVINSRADIALATGADGVHLTSSAGQLTASQIRNIYSAAYLPEPTISISCHSLADVIAARESGVSMILFGPVFEKVITTSPDAGATTRAVEGLGLESLAVVCSTAAPTPVLALGGVTAENAAACLQVGAAGIASIRLFVG